MDYNVTNGSVLFLPALLGYTLSDLLCLNYYPFPAMALGTFLELASRSIATTSPLSNPWRKRTHSSSGLVSRTTAYIQPRPSHDFWCKHVRWQEVVQVGCDEL